jgi:hypothetical protein
MRHQLCGTLGSDLCAAFHKPADQAEPDEPSGNCEGTDQEREVTPARRHQRARSGKCITF